MRIGRVVWELLAILDTDGPIDWALLRKDLDPQIKKMRRLLDHARRDGPPLGNKNKAEQLTDHIYEFKAGPKKGPKLRVFWFYGEARRLIICTHSALKARRTVPGEIDRAEKLRTLYLEAGQGREIEIVGLEELEGESDGRIER